MPSLAHPYVDTFFRLKKMIDRTQGFFFLPVESTSPDLGRDFARWLSLHGWEAEILDLNSDRVRADLVLKLERPQGTSSRRLVLVLGPHDLSNAELPPMFAAINWARDSIAKKFRGPLFWWGTEAFHLTTRVRAPDLWSIAGPSFRPEIGQAGAPR